MGKAEGAVDRRLAYVVGAVLLVGVAWAAASFLGPDDAPPAAPAAAPPGKVWSAEHGHWHDLPGAALADTTGP